MALPLKVVTTYAASGSMKFNEPRFSHCFKIVTSFADPCTPRPQKNEYVCLGVEKTFTAMSSNILKAELV